MTEEETRAVAKSLALAGSEPMTLAGLEHYLAKAADLLRGSVGQADFKQFILPVTFDDAHQKANEYTCEHF